MSAARWLVGNVYSQSFDAFYTIVTIVLCRYSSLVQLCRGALPPATACCPAPSGRAAVGQDALSALAHECELELHPLWVHRDLH